MLVIWSRYGFALLMSDINQKLNMKGIGDSNSNAQRYSHTKIYMELENMVYIVLLFVSVGFVLFCSINLEIL